MTCPFCPPAKPLGVVLGCWVLRHPTDLKRFLIVPTQHEADLHRLVHPSSLLQAAVLVAKELRLGHYRVKINQGSYQKIKHAHLHLINSSVIPDYPAQPSGLSKP